MLRFRAQTSIILALGRLGIDDPLGGIGSLSGQTEHRSE